MYCTWLGTLNIKSCKLMCAINPLTERFSLDTGQINKWLPVAISKICFQNTETASYCDVIFINTDHNLYYFFLIVNLQYAKCSKVRLSAKVHHADPTWIRDCTRLRKLLGMFEWRMKLAGRSKLTYSPKR